jgi:hypothetical protein
MAVSRKKNYLLHHSVIKIEFISEMAKGSQNPQIANLVIMRVLTCTLAGIYPLCRPIGHPADWYVVSEKTKG